MAWVSVCAEMLRFESIHKYVRKHPGKTNQQGRGCKRSVCEKSWRAAISRGDGASKRVPTNARVERDHVVKPLYPGAFADPPRLHPACTRSSDPRSNIDLGPGEKSGRQRQCPGAGPGARLTGRASTWLGREQTRAGTDKSYFSCWNTFVCRLAAALRTPVLIPPVHSPLPACGRPAGQNTDTATAPSSPAGVWFLGDRCPMHQAHKPRCQRHTGLQFLNFFLLFNF